MSSKHPDSPEITQEEWDKWQLPLIKIDYILKGFSKKYGFYFKDTWSHDWPRRVLSVRKRSFIGEYYIDKIIHLGLASKNLPIYNMSINVFNAYGFKEFYSFVPFLRHKRSTWKRFSWSKQLAEFKETIDPERLKQLLGEAKQILDNFDESQLQEVK